MMARELEAAGRLQEAEQQLEEGERERERLKLQLARLKEQMIQEQVRGAAREQGLELGKQVGGLQREEVTLPPQSDLL